MSHPALWLTRCEIHRVSQLFTWLTVMVKPVNSGIGQSWLGFPSRPLSDMRLWATDLLSLSQGFSTACYLDIFVLSGMFPQKDLHSAGVSCLSFRLTGLK